MLASAIGVLTSTIGRLECELCEQMMLMPSCVSFRRAKLVTIVDTDRLWAVVGL